jgi:hypothetical protein
MRGVCKLVGKCSFPPESNKADAAVDHAVIAAGRA